ncbi:unnamed protein product [Hymenolepis diminuta]|uniref:Uncharacterized protein n=1 Tax=Hymenolepis diminuta TaxID=6216 RepID=A0A564Y146_HYMDI|nr:unnamed protein product [Hymenolepis diminuta]
MELEFFNANCAFSEYRTTRIQKSDKAVRRKSNGVMGLLPIHVVKMTVFLKYVKIFRVLVSLNSSL